MNKTEIESAARAVAAAGIHPKDSAQVVAAVLIADALNVLAFEVGSLTAEVRDQMSRIRNER